VDAWLISFVEMVSGVRPGSCCLKLRDCFWLVVARSTYPNQFSEKKLECTNHQSLPPCLFRSVVLVSWWRDHLTGPAVGEGEGARVNSSQNLELSPTG
jgi:hypothetical protein